MKSHFVCLSILIFILWHKIFKLMKLWIYNITFIISNTLINLNISFVRIYNSWSFYSVYSGSHFSIRINLILYRFLFICITTPYRNIFIANRWIFLKNWCWSNFINGFNNNVNYELIQSRLQHSLICCLYYIPFNLYILNHFACPLFNNFIFQILLNFKPELSNIKLWIWCKFFTGFKITLSCHWAPKNFKGFLFNKLGLGLSFIS